MVELQLFLVWSTTKILTNVQYMLERIRVVDEEEINYRVDVLLQEQLDVVCIR